MKGPTSIRKDPACGTCRRKCRKCDRTRPVCKRCTEKGLHCEGYPPKFTFWDYNGDSGTSTSQTGLTSEDNSQPQKDDQLPSAVPSEPSLDNQSPNSPSSQLVRDASLHLQQSPLSDDTTGSVGTILDGQEWLLAHFDETMADNIAIAVPGLMNPFRQHVLPLAQRHGGVMHALLGLSAGHVCTSHKITGRPIEAVSLEHRVAALEILGSMLLQESSRGLDDFEEDCVLAIVLLLVLHDICEHGVSPHGSHLDGVAFLCARKANNTDMSHPSKATSLVFMATLSWLDMLRGFSGAEKLKYPPEVRTCVRDHWSFGLYMMIGIPPDLFYCAGTVLDAARCHRAGDLATSDFQIQLNEAEIFLRTWDPEAVVYPTNDKEWKLLAGAFRHACLLRVMRWPDTFAVSCEEPKIRESVAGILDACASMTKHHPCHKRLLFPLFMAGADTNSPHQKHYVELAIEQIKSCTGFPHPEMSKLLQTVWNERRTNTRGLVNCPWMEFTCSSLLQGPQHAYLFF